MLDYPLIFASLMALAILVYAILDGYDLGVGMLLPLDNRQHADMMINSIGPFWDANETWLVLAVGILLIAFPSAHSAILMQLYLPVCIMLAGLILRGVAFDLRTKAASDMQATWNRLFKVGSWIASLAQGFMLGLYVLGFEYTPLNIIFASISALCVCMAYIFIGSAWLVMKTESALQKKAIIWCRKAAWLCGFGVLLTAIINPLFNPLVYQRWFTNLNHAPLYLIPALCLIGFWVNDRYLKFAPQPNDNRCWIPFVSATAIFTLCFIALSYSYFPYLIPGEITLWQAASSDAALRFTLTGVVITIPAIIGYTIMAYRIFWGKTEKLRYYAD